MKPASLTSALLAAKGHASPTELLTARPGRVSAPAAPVPAAPRPRPFEGRVNMSFRLDEARHLRLRIAAAHLHMSAQQVLESALDRFLSELADAPSGTGCACLAQPRCTATESRADPSPRLSSSR